MGLVGLVSFVSGIEIRINRISGISLLFEWNEHWIYMDQPDHRWCKEVNGKPFKRTSLFFELN